LRPYVPVGRRGLEEKKKNLSDVKSMKFLNAALFMVMFEYKMK